MTADLLDLDALTAAYAGAVVVQLPINVDDDAPRQAETVLADLTLRRLEGSGFPPWTTNPA